MPRIPVHSIDDPLLAPYRALNQRNLTRLSGLFIAEGDKVVQRLIASRYPVASLLAEAEWAERLAPDLPPETPIYVAEPKLLEATIGFNKREEGEEGESEGESSETTTIQGFESAGKIKWTSQDHKFLRALKIAIDEEAR